MGVKNIAAYLNQDRIFTRDGGRWGIGIGQVHRILTRTTYVGRHEFNKRAKSKMLKPVRSFNRGGRICLTAKWAAKITNCGRTVVMWICSLGGLAVALLLAKPAAAFEPVVQLTVSSPSKPVISGTTNLPDDTPLMVGIQVAREDAANPGHILYPLMGEQAVGYTATASPPGRSAWTAAPTTAAHTSRASQYRTWLCPRM